MDYDVPALVTVADRNTARRTMPIDSNQAHTGDELQSNRNRADHMINIISIENPYPRNRHLRYRLKDIRPPAHKRKTHAMFEMWSSLFPTCVNVSSRDFSMRLDVGRLNVTQRSAWKLPQFM